MQVGDFIRFRYTGAHAEIVAVEPDGSLRVWLTEDEEEIPAFPEDVLLEADFQKVEESQVQKEKRDKKREQLSTEELYFGKEEVKRRKIEELRQPLSERLKKPEIQQEEEAPQPEALQPLNLQEPTDSGMHLALWEQQRGIYGIFIINDSTTGLTLDFELALNEKTTHRLSQYLEPHNFFAVGELSRAELNDRPRLLVRFPSLRFEKSIKVKIQQLLRNKRQLPIMGVEAHHYLLTEEVREVVERNELGRYTQLWLNSIPKDRPYKVPIFDVEERARFPQEIDLHLERLTDNPEEVLKSDYIAFKMQSLERYVNNALRLGVPEVFIIHGIGKGFLKEKVHAFLRKNPHVAHFKNEYFKKYEYGATKVIFKK